MASLRRCNVWRGTALERTGPASKPEPRGCVRSNTRGLVRELSVLLADTIQCSGEECCLRVKPCRKPQKFNDRRIASLPSDVVWVRDVSSKGSLR